MSDDDTTIKQFHAEQENISDAFYKRYEEASVVIESYRELQHKCATVVNLQKQRLPLERKKDEIMQRAARIHDEIMKTPYDSVLEKEESETREALHAFLSSPDNIRRESIIKEQSSLIARLNSPMVKKHRAIVLKGIVSSRRAIERVVTAESKELSLLARYTPSVVKAAITKKARELNGLNASKYPGNTFKLQRAFLASESPDGKAAFAAEIRALTTNTCSICLDTFAVGTRLPCNHAFHAACIDGWTRLKPNCPCCRADADDDSK